MHSSKCIDRAVYRSVCDSVEERSSNLALGPQHWGKAPSHRGSCSLILLPSVFSRFFLWPSTFSPFPFPCLHSCVWLSQLPPAFYQDTTSKWFSELSSQQAQVSRSLLDLALDVSISHVSPPCPAGDQPISTHSFPHVSQTPHPMSTWHLVHSSLLFLPS